MGSDSKLVGVVFPVALAAALETHCGAAKQDFIRAAVAEKLARDFGENISPVLTRGEQGRRTDLERLHKEIIEIRASENALYERIKTLAAEEIGGAGNAPNPPPQGRAKKQ